MPNTAVGLFSTPSVADQVAHELGESSLPGNEIRVLTEPLYIPSSGVLSFPRNDFQVNLERELMAVGASLKEANAFALGVAKGGALVFATGSTEQVAKAGEVMNQHGAVETQSLNGVEPDLQDLRTQESMPIGAESTQAGRTRQSSGGARMFVW